MRINTKKILFMNKQLINFDFDYHPYAWEVLLSA